jgi:death-on-curing protein
LSEIEYLTLNEVLLLHARLIQATGGSRGLRDLGLLESAVARPQATFAGADLYPDLWAKAAALMHSLVLNHPFVDGNKRVALTAAGVFLDLNGYRMNASNQEAVAFTLQVIAGDLDLEAMAAWLKTNSAPIDDL